MGVANLRIVTFQEATLPVAPWRRGGEAGDRVARRDTISTSESWLHVSQTNKMFYTARSVYPPCIPPFSKGGRDLPLVQHIL